MSFDTLSGEVLKMQHVPQAQMALLWGINNRRRERVLTDEFQACGKPQ